MSLVLHKCWYNPLTDDHSFAMASDGSTYFGGDKSYIMNSPYIDCTKHQVSWSLYVKIKEWDKIDGGCMILDSRSNEIGIQPLYIHKDDGIQFYDSNTQDDTDFPIKINKGQWYHIAIVCNFNKVSCYVDGQCIGKKTCDISGITNMPLFLCGRHRSQPGTGLNLWLTGNIKDLRIYNHALTIQEINEIRDRLMIHY